MPTLSLCMMASRSPATVRAVLELWRPHVDEIVLAIDERRHPDLTDAVGDLADKLFVVPTKPTSVVEEFLMWLHAQCSSEWCIRSDDDEIPTTGLIADLPSLIDNRAITQVFLPIRWPYGSTGEVLVDEPWREHLAPRLVRNLPAIWIAPRRLHTSNEAVGARHVAANGLLHLTLLVDSAQARSTRVARYETIGDAPDHESGLSINSYYVPEERPGLAVMPIPAVDRALVESVLEAGRRPTPSPSRRVEATIVSQRELDRWRPANALDNDEIRAAVWLERPVTRMVAGSFRHVVLSVTNRGTTWWPWEPDANHSMINVGQRWWRSDGSEIEWPFVRSHLSEAVAPGATTRVIAALQAPSEPGHHTVALGVVHELVRWLEDPVRLEIEVVQTVSTEAQVSA